MSNRLPYCEDCVISMTEAQREECMLKWRPQLGTKCGFPKDGWNCPKDTFVPIAKAMRAEWERIMFEEEGE